MAKAAIGLEVNAAVELYSPSDGGCTAFLVHCVDTSATWIEVRVEGLHGSDWAAVRQGRDIVFRLNNKDAGGIYRVRARGHGGGTATIDYMVVANTDRGDNR